ncbi:putative integral membrane protein (TIGR00698 family) [Orbus hercynius]|uniref:Putative integral membrane protein (TIGR00698 family) n=1 Tax=Orbus hercynius TaxID=593135 RepID=A0A495RIM8_9GAMM|nr:YeiH family protein [Orbus hercynius]RKS87403.1 putative integral membrane protein (TIGR00698 family) [Orbus hercynius]
MNVLTKYFPGFVLSLSIAIGATYIATFSYIQTIGLSAIVLAIIIGLIIGNTVYPQLSRACQAGVDLCKGKILRIAIVLFGIKLTFQDIALIGYQGVLIDILMVSLTFLLTVIIGIKLFHIDQDSAILIGSGCSICGAAAVIATESTINTTAEKVTIAVAVVVVFGTLSMFIYPIIYAYLVQIWPVSQSQFGIYIGSTIHEVAQVVGAGDAIGKAAVNTAVISKMIRVLLLAPFLLILSTYLRHKQQGNQQKSKLIIPWFAVGFLIMACINSLGFLPAELVNIIIVIDNVLLTMAMAALGLTSHYSAFKKAGIKPLLLGLVIFIWLIIGGATINLLVTYVLS